MVVLMTVQSVKRMVRLRRIIAPPVGLTERDVSKRTHFHRPSRLYCNGGCVGHCFGSTAEASTSVPPSDGVGRHDP